MRRFSALFLLLLPSVAIAQDEAAKVEVMSPEVQVAAAVLPLPPTFRETATVMGYRYADRLVVLREGAGPMICLADDPKREGFHAACYHESLEPFMKRGRDLRAGGITGSGVDSVRYPEVRSGKLPMPNRAALWSMTGSWDGVNVEEGTVGEGVRSLYVVYMPGATPESTGLPATPGPLPWLMFPGTPKAHIMFIPSM